MVCVSSAHCLPGNALREQKKKMKQLQSRSASNKRAPGRSGVEENTRKREQRGNPRGRTCKNYYSLHRNVTKYNVNTALDPSSA